MGLDGASRVAGLVEKEVRGFSPWPAAGGTSPAWTCPVHLCSLPEAATEAGEALDTFRIFPSMVIWRQRSPS